ncbi:hypothetical protein SprV_0301103500 [Sparganum proliferum]
MAPHRRSEEALTGGARPRLTPFCVNPYVLRDAGSSKMEWDQLLVTAWSPVTPAWVTRLEPCLWLRAGRRGLRGSKKWGSFAVRSGQVTGLVALECVPPPVSVSVGRIIVIPKPVADG